MDPETTLAFVASSYGVLMAVSPMLQIRAILARATRPASPPAISACCFVGFLLWLAYGIASDNWAIIIPNIVAAIVSSRRSCITLRYRPRP